MNYEIPEDVSISLLLTRRCNFKCRHCMYSCGPMVSAKYMSRETVAAALRGAERLRDLNIRVSVNLIGGEPTVDMEEFRRCLQHVSSIQGIRMEMTTNGWWMHTVETTRWFMDAIRDTLYRTNEGDFRIRVSNDKYHDEFRPAHLRGKSLVHRLDEIFNGLEDPVFVEEISCCEKDHEHVGFYDECPTCGSTDMGHTDREVCQRVPSNDTRDPWIYVEEQPPEWGREMVNPHGRAKYFGANDKGSMFGGCHATYSLTFNPDGTLNDACATGTVDDDPLALLFITQRGVAEVKPQCINCQESFAEWRKHHLRAARKEATIAASAAKPKEDE